MYGDRLDLGRVPALTSEIYGSSFNGPGRSEFTPQLYLSVLQATYYSYLDGFL